MRFSNKARFLISVALGAIAILVGGCEGPSDGNALTRVGDNDSSSAATSLPIVGNHQAKPQGVALPIFQKMGRDVEQAREHDKGKKPVLPDF